MDNKCHIILNKSLSAKIKSVIRESIGNITDSDGKPITSVKHDELGIIVNEKGVIELNIDITTQGGEATLKALSKLLQTRQRDLFVTTENAGVQSITFQKELFEQGSEEIYNNIVDEIRKGNLEYASFVGEFRYSTNYLLNQIKSIENGDLTKEEKAIRVKAKMKILEYTKQVHERNTPAGVKGVDSYNKFTTNLNHELEKLNNRYVVESFTLENYKIPATVQIHYDSHLSKEDNVFFLEDEVELSTELQELNNNIIEVLINEGEDVQKATRKKDKNGGYSFMFWKYNREESNRQNKTIWDQMKFTNPKPGGKDIEVLFNNDKQYQVYVLDGTRLDAGADLAEVSQKQFFTSREITEDVRKRQGDTSGLLASFDTDNLNMRISRNVSINANERLAKYIEVYNSKVDKSEKINPDFIFGAGRIPLLGTNIKVVRKTDTGWEVTEEPYNQFVTKGFNKNVDFVIYNTKKVTREDVVEDIEEIGAEGESWSYTIVKYSEGEDVKTEFVNIDQFFDGTTFKTNEFEKFITDHFSMMYDMNSTELKEIHDLLYKEDETNPNSLLTSLLSIDGNTITDTKGRKVPKFISYKILKDFLVEENYQLDSTKHARAKLYYNLLNPIAYGLFEAKVAKDSITVEDVEMSVADFSTKVTEFAKSLGYDTTPGAPNKRIPVVKLNLAENVKPLNDTNIGLVKFKAYKKDGNWYIPKDTYEIPEGLEEVNLETSFYYYTGKTSGKPQLAIGEILENGRVLSNLESNDVKAFALKGLRETLNLEVSDELLTEDDFVDHIVEKGMLNIGWGDLTGNVLLVPYGNKLVPSKVKARDLKGGAEIVKNINDAISKVDLKEFKRKQEHFKKLVPFMFIFHQYREFYIAMTRATSIQSNDRILNEFSGGYTIEVDGKREPIWRYLEKLLKPLRMEEVSNIPESEKTLQQVYNPNSAETIDEFREVLFSSFGVMNPNVDLTGLGKLYKEVEDILGIEKQKENLKNKVPGTKPIDDVEIVKLFTEKVLNSIDLSVNVGDIYKNNKKVETEKEFVNGFIQSFTDNVLSQSIVTSLPNIVKVETEGYQESRKSYLYTVGLNLRLVKNALLKVDKNNKLIGEITEWLESSLEDKIENIEFMNEVLDTKIGDRTIMEITNEQQISRGKDKLNKLFTQNTLDDLWEYNEKILVLNVKGDTIDKDGNNIPTSLSIPLRLEFKDGVRVTGNFRNIEYRDGKFVYNPTADLAYTASFSFSQSYFDADKFNLDKFKADIVKQIIESKKTRYNKAKENKQEVDNFGNAVLNNEFDPFITNLVGGLKAYAHIPAAWEEVSRGISAGKISRSNLFTNLSSKDPFYTVLKKPSNRLSILKPITKNTSEEDTQRTEELGNISDEEVADDYSDIDAYIQESNEQFTNDYDISDDEINDYLSLATKNQVTLEGWETEAIRDLIKRSRVQGTPIAVSFRNHIALNTTSAGVFYHEMFHQVFNGFLYPSERNEILNILNQRVLVTDEMLEEFKEQRGLQGKSGAFVRAKFLEEKLADMYGQYKVDQKKNKDSFWRRMLGNKIVDFFEKLLKLRNLFRSDKILQLFDRMDSGYYAERTHIPFERPDFSIISFTDRGIQKTILQNKFMLKNKLVDFIAGYSEKGTQEEKLDAFRKSLLNETITFIQSLNKIENFKNLSSNEFRSLQDKILLPIYAGISNDDYKIAIDNFLTHVRKLNKLEKQEDVSERRQFDKLYFKNIIHTSLLLAKPTFENTSKENLNILYNEIQKQGLAEWNISEAPDGFVDDGSGNTEADPEVNAAHENFEGSNLNIDPSATLSKYIKTLVGGYVLEREIEVNAKGDTIKLPIELDSLTVYNSLIKLFAGKDINTKDFEHDKDLFLDTLDFYADMHYRSSPKYEYTGVQEFRDFIYRYFEIDTIVKVEEPIDEKSYTVYDRTVAIPSTKHGDMIRFLFAFSNNISEFNLLNITGKSESDYYFTPTQRHSVVKDVLEDVAKRRKGLKLEDKDITTHTNTTIAAIITEADNVSGNIYTRTKNIKKLLSEIGIKFSTEYILYSLADKVKNREVLQHFDNKFKPIAFEVSYFDAIFKLSATEATVEDLADAENKTPDSDQLKKSLSIRDIYWSVYASVFFNAQMSTLTIKDSNGKDRYVITKDSHIGNTFKGRYWVRGDGLVFGERGKRKTSVTELTNPTQAKQFGIGALFGDNGLGDNIAFYPIGQMETTKDKFFVSGNKDNFVHITDQGEISIGSNAVKRLLSIVNEELALVNKFLTHIKTNLDFKGVDGYMQPVYVYREDGDKKIFDEDATIEATLKANKLTNLFEIETLLNKKDFIEFKELVWNAIREGKPLNAEKIDKDIVKRLTTKVEFEAKEEHKNFENIPVPSSYKYAGAKFKEEKKLEHMAWNAVLNMMINGRDVLHDVYGEFGATFKDMQADRLKRAKALAALGASFSAFRSKEINDELSYMVLYDGTTKGTGTTSKFRIEVDSFDLLIEKTKQQLIDRGFLDDTNIKAFESLKDLNELEDFLDNLNADDFKVRNPESTDGESIVSPLHRIQQFHDLARTDTKNNKVAMYVLSEGFMWLDENNRPVRFNRAKHQKEYENCVAHSIKTNANFGKYKTVSVYKENVFGVEVLKYIKQSEFVLTGEWVRTLRKDLTEKEKIVLAKTYIKMFMSAQDNTLSLEKRFMSARGQYKNIEKFYKPKPGEDKMYKWFTDITQNDIGHLIFKTSSKTAKRIGQITMTPFGAKMLQQEVPNWKEEALSGTQMMEHILSDQDSELEVFVEGKKQKISDIKEQFRQNLVDMFNIDKALVLESLKIYSTGNGYEGTLGFEALYEIIRKSMAASGRTDLDIEEFTTDASGNPKYNMVPSRFHSYMNMVSSILNKAYKLKRNAESYAIASSRFYNVAISKTTDKIVSTHHRNGTSDDYTFRPLEVTDQIRYDEDGVPYEVEVHECVVSSSREYEHLMLNQELTEEQMYALLPMDSPLREMLGYRIPTEGKRSMKIFKIVDFLPSYYGSTIITTTQSMLEDGHDMDIDKQYTEKPYEIKTPKTLDAQIQRSPSSVLELLMNNAKVLNLQGLGKNIQIGYVYSLQDFQRAGILFTDDSGDLTTATPLTTQDQANRLNNAILDYQKTSILKKETIERMDKDVIKIYNTKSKSQDIKSLIVEVEALKENAKGRKEIKKELKETLTDIYRNVADSLSQSFENGISIDSIKRIVGDSFEEIEDDLKPFTNEGIVTTKRIRNQGTDSERLMFNKVFGLFLTSHKNKAVDQLQSVNEELSSIFESLNLSREDLETKIAEIKLLKETWNSILGDAMDVVELFGFHLFPFYANKQLELGKVLLSNDHTRFVNKKQTEETDKSYFDAETKMQVLINIADEVRHFNTISQQVKDSISTIRGAKNIGITASAGKQGVSYAENGLKLSSRMKFKYKADDGSVQEHVFGDFVDIDTQLYNRLEGDSIDAKVAWLRSLEKDGVKLLNEKDIVEYEKTMRKHLLSKFFSSTKFLGMNVTLTTDSVKDNRQIPLNLTEDVIAVDGLLIQLNVPYQLRVGIFTHRAIKEISKLQEEGLDKGDIIGVIQSKYGGGETKKEKLKAVTKDKDLKVEEEEDIEEYITVPSLEDIYTEKNGEHVMDIVDFYYQSLAISKAMIPLNKLTGMTKGISNDLKDYPDYIALAKWIGLKVEDVIIDSKVDPAYVRFIEELFEAVDKNKPPVEGLENYKNNPVIKNQLINFFDYYFYVMYQVTPIKNRMVQKGMLTFLNGLGWIPEVMIPLIGSDYAFREQGSLENETVSLTSIADGSKSNFKVADLLKSVDSLVSSYGNQKSLFAGLIKSIKSYFLGNVVAMNGFTALNPESIRYGKLELSNEALDPITRVNFKHNGAEYSIALRDVIKVFYWSNLLETGMTKTNTSVSDMIPLNHRLYTLADPNLHLPIVWKNMIGSIYNSLPDFLKRRIKPITTKSNRRFYGDGFVIALKDKRSMRKDQHEFGVINIKDENNKEKSIVHETVLSFDRTETVQDEKGNNKEVSTRLVVYRPIAASTKFSYMSPYTLSLLGKNKVTLHNVEPTQKGTNDYILSEGEFISNNKLSFTTKNKSLDIGDTIIKDDEVFIVKSHPIKLSEDKVIYGLIPNGVNVELNAEHIENLKKLKSDLESKIWSTFVPAIKNTNVKITKEEKMNEDMIEYKRLTKEGTITPLQKSKYKSLKKYLSERTEEKEAKDKKTQLWKNVKVDREVVKNPETLSKPTGTINVYWGKPESSTSTKILSNLAPRKFTYNGIEFGSVEHAYQSLKSGSFDNETYEAYVKVGGFGRKIRGKGTIAELKAANSLELMKSLVVESFKQNPTSRDVQMLLQYETFTHNTNELIDKAFLEGLKLAQQQMQTTFKPIVEDLKQLKETTLITDYMIVKDTIETYEELTRDGITELDKERIRKESGVSCKIKT